MLPRARSRHNRRLHRFLLAFVVAAIGASLVPSAAHARAATVFSPLGGGSVTSAPGSHLISYDGDWSMDIGGSGDVVVRVASSQSLSIRVERISAACSGGRQGGQAVRVRVHLDGVSVALLIYSHLANVAVSEGQAISNGTRLGSAATGLPVNSTCWTGPHIHFEARNDASYACHTGLGVGAGVNAGTAIGAIGVVGANGKNQRCGTLPSSGVDPTGSFDAATSPTAGRVRVTGWGFDRDHPSVQIQMHVYVGGQAGTPGAEGKAFTANTHRADVDNVHRVGAYHGLDATFDTAKRGSQPVCLYAINIAGGNNVLLGCKTVNIGNPNPVGHYDSATSPAGGQVHVRGWGFDPNDHGKAIQMHVYVGGPSGAPGAEGHSFTADVSRPDVHAIHKTGSNHGLHVTFDTKKRGNQPVCLYAINVGAGVNADLGCKPVVIGEPAVLTPQNPLVSPLPSGSLTDGSATTTTPPAEPAVDPVVDPLAASCSLRAITVKRGKRASLGCVGVTPSARGRRQVITRLQRVIRGKPSGKPTKTTVKLTSVLAGSFSTRRLRRGNYKVTFGPKRAPFASALLRVR